MSGHDLDASFAGAMGARGDSPADPARFVMLATGNVRLLLPREEFDAKVNGDGALLDRLPPRARSVEKPPPALRLTLPALPRMAPLRITSPRLLMGSQSGWPAIAISGRPASAQLCGFPPSPAPPQLIVPCGSAVRMEHQTSPLWQDTQPPSVQC